MPLLWLWGLLLLGFYMNRWIVNVANVVNVVNVVELGR